MPFFDVQDGTGFRMNYDHHKGLVPETVVFIHGNLASNRWWIPTEQVLAKKSAGKNWTGHMLAVEFRGCGKSSAPRSEKEVDMHLFARDFIAFIKSLDHVGPVHLVGHSTGGLIAALMMAMEPELFKRAVLLDPVGAKGVKFDDAMIGAFDAMKADKRVVATVMNSTIYKNDPTSDFFNQVVVEDAFAAVKVVGHLVLKALDGLDVRKEVELVKNPTLVLHGAHDVILAEAESRALAAHLAHGQFELCLENGHSANVETPETFVERVGKFLFDDKF